VEQWHGENGVVCRYLEKDPLCESARLFEDSNCEELERTSCNGETIPVGY
jgi:hypothetical protein